MSFCFLSYSDSKDSKLGYHSYLNYVSTQLCIK